MLKGEMRARLDNALKEEPSKMKLDLNFLFFDLYDEYQREKDLNKVYRQLVEYQENKIKQYESGEVK